MSKVKKIKQKKWPAIRRDERFLTNGEALAFLFIEILYITFIISVIFSGIFRALFSNAESLKNVFGFALLWLFFGLIFATILYLSNIKINGIKTGAAKYSKSLGMYSIISAVNYFLVINIFWLYRCITIGRK